MDYRGLGSELNGNNYINLTFKHLSQQKETLQLRHARHKRLQIKTKSVHLWTKKSKGPPFI